MTDGQLFVSSYSFSRSRYQEQVAGIVRQMQADTPGAYQIVSPDEDLILRPLSHGDPDYNSFKRVSWGMYGRRCLHGSCAGRQAWMQADRGWMAD